MIFPCRTALQSFSIDRMTPYLGEGTSFKVDVVTWGMGFTHEEILELIDKLCSFIPFKVHAPISLPSCPVLHVESPCWRVGPQWVCLPRKLRRWLWAANGPPRHLITGKGQPQEPPAHIHPLPCQCKRHRPSRSPNAVIGNGASCPLALHHPLRETRPPLQASRPTLPRTAGTSGGTLPPLTGASSRGDSALDAAEA